MKQDPSIIAMWQSFLKENPQLSEETIFEAWSFGNSAEMADELSNLVLKGQKTGTASAHDCYIYDEEELPEELAYSIILDGSGKARCVIQTISVEVLPFNEVTAEQAFKEGEGDRTLSYWRGVHQTFWEQEFVDYPLTFSEEMLVVYEEFKVIYK